MKLEVGSLVYIEWEDSYGCSPRWEPMKDVSPAVHICKSVGWLLAKTSKSLVIVPHVSGFEDTGISNQHGCGDMTIPTACVKRFEPLTIPAKKNHRRFRSLA